MQQARVSIFFELFSLGAVFGERKRLKEHIRKRRQSGRAPGVPEEDGLAAGEGAPADEVDQAAHSLAGVDGIEEDAFLAGGQLNRFPFQVADLGVPFADVVVVDQHMIHQGHRFQAEVGGGGGGQGGDLRLKSRPLRDRR